jgi:hypothetical protein
MQNPIRIPSLSRARQGARRAGRRAGLLAAVLAIGSLPFGSACTKVQNDNSSSYLIVNSLLGASGAEPAKMGGTLASDVRTKGGIFEDPGQVTFKLGLKDAGTPDSPTKPTSANFITVSRYHVDFVRIDGGVAPASFDGALTVTVNDIGGVGTMTLVPASSKTVAPLSALVGSLTEIQTIATVTFFGKDQAGRDIQVKATISVNFADWGDPA